MQIVIDIDEELYQMCKDLHGDSDTVESAIANGTLLQKGHGRIIDESQITGTFIWDNGYIECYAPTIIQAESEVSDADSN